MSLISYCRIVSALLLLPSATLPCNAQSTAVAETIQRPVNVYAQRYSNTSAEVFWARPSTFGLRYEIRRDGSLLSNTDGVSYYDSTLTADKAPSYDIIAIDMLGQRSLPSSVTVPARNGTTDTLAPPANVTGKRYSDTAVEIFWSRSATPGMRYEISRDGTLRDNIDGTSYYDDSLSLNSSPLYDIVAIDPQGRRSSSSSITAPGRHPPVPPLSPPTGLVAQRYSSTAVEIFWARATTFGLDYEISRDGVLMGHTSGTSYFDNTLNKNSSANYSIIAIDRQGQRSSAVSINVTGNNVSNPDPVDPLITAESYELILKELIKLVNGIPLYDTLKTQADVTDPGITFISVSSDPVEDDTFGLGFVYDYSCDAGGTIEQFVFTEPGSQRYTFADCDLETGNFNGILKEYYIGREGTGVTAIDYLVDKDNQKSLLSGSRGTSFYRGGPGRNRYWHETSLEVHSASQNTLSLTTFELDAHSFFNHANQNNHSNLLVSFDVTAPWTQGQSIHVEATLLADIETDTQFTWQTGDLVAVADDESQLTLTPGNVAQRTIDIVLAGSEDVIIRDWSDGFEIYCAYTSIAECGSF